MSLTRISIRQFEVFAMVAELESNLGLRVFDRSTRRVELSGAGRIIDNRELGLVVRGACLSQHE